MSDSLGAIATADNLALRSDSALAQQASKQEHVLRIEALPFAAPVSCRWSGCSEQFSNTSQLHTHTSGHSPRADEDDYPTFICSWEECSFHYTHKPQHPDNEYRDRVIFQTAAFRHVKCHSRREPSFRCVLCDDLFDNCSNASRHVVEQHANRITVPASSLTGKHTRESEAKDPITENSHEGRGPKPKRARKDSLPGSAPTPAIPQQCRVLPAMLPKRIETTSDTSASATASSAPPAQISPTSASASPLAVAPNTASNAPIAHTAAATLLQKDRLEAIQAELPVARVQLLTAQSDLLTLQALLSHLWRRFDPSMAAPTLRAWDDSADDEAHLAAQAVAADVLEKTLDEIQEQEDHKRRHECALRKKIVKLEQERTQLERDAAVQGRKKERE